MTVEQRLKRLETQTFRLRWIVIVLVAISAGAVIFSVTRREDIPGVIRAQSFEVIADNGKVAAKMGHAVNNGGVWIFNADGYSTVFLTTDDFGAGSVATFNGKDPRKPEGTVLFSLASENGAEAVMRLLSEQGHGLKLVGDDGRGAGGRIVAIDNDATVIASWP